MARIRRNALAPLFLIAAVSASAAPANAATIESNANGNAITGGMSFTPRVIEAEVGDKVVWHNTDFLAPHTSTEDHDLWNVGGHYGGPPATIVPGYGPGDTKGRTFEAGTHSYYCVVHGAAAMSGFVSVPVSLTTRKRNIVAQWAPSPGHGDLQYDVQINRRGSSGWKFLENGTSKKRGSFNRRRGTTRVRARVISASDRGAKTGWSPVAKI